MKRLIFFTGKARVFLVILFLLAAALGLYCAAGLTCTDAAGLRGSQAAQAAAVFESEFGIPLPGAGVSAEAHPFAPPRGALAVLGLTALLCAALAGRSWGDPLVLLPGLAVSVCLSGGALARLPGPNTDGALCAALVLQAALLSGWSAALLRRFVQASTLQDRYAAMAQVLPPLLAAALPALLPVLALGVGLCLTPFSAALALGRALLAATISGGLCAALLLPALALLLEPVLRITRHAPLPVEGRAPAHWAVRLRIPLALLSLVLCAGTLWQALRLPTPTPDADGQLAVLLPADEAQRAVDALSPLLGSVLTPAKPLAPLPAAPEPETCTAGEFAARYAVEPETAARLWSELDKTPDETLTLDAALARAVDSGFYTRLADEQAKALSDAWQDTRRYTDLYTVPQAAAAFHMTQSEAAALFSAAGGGRQRLSGRRIVTWQYEQQRLLSSCDDYHAMLTAYDRLGSGDIAALDPLFDSETVQALFDYYNVDAATGALYRYNVLRYAVHARLAEQRGEARQAAASDALQALRQQEAAAAAAVPDWPVGPQYACLSYRVSGRAADTVSALSAALTDAGCHPLPGGPAAEAAERQQALAALLPRAAVLLPAGLLVLGLLVLRRVLPALALTVCTAGALCPPTVLILHAVPGRTALPVSALLLCAASFGCFAAARRRLTLRRSCTVRETARRTLEALAVPTPAGCIVLAAGAPMLSAACPDAALPLCAGALCLAAAVLLLLPGTLSAVDRAKQPAAPDALL